MLETFIFRPAGTSGQTHPSTTPSTKSKLAAGVALLPLVFFACEASTPLRVSSADAQQMCASIPDAEANAGLQGMRSNIDGVEPLRKSVYLGKSVQPRLVGATVYVRATPGMTREWASRVLQCHLARISSGASAANARDVLDISGADATVSSTETGFAISIRSEDVAVGREIYRRAQTLTL